MIATIFDWLSAPGLVRTVAVILMWALIIWGSIWCLKLLAGRRDG